MSSHDLTVAGYVLIVLAGVGLQLLGSREGVPFLPLGAVLGRVMRTRSGRVGVMAGWAWIGIHFFAR
jgi:Family of unknown function (DUF6186)